MRTLLTLTTLIFLNACASSSMFCGGIVNPCDYSAEHAQAAEQVREDRRVEWARMEKMDPELRKAYLAYREQELRRAVAARADEWRQYEAATANADQLVSAVTTAGRSFANPTAGQSTAVYAQPAVRQVWLQGGNLPPAPPVPGMRPICANGYCSY